MPLPKPNLNEEKKDFVMRCMGNDTMVKEFPKQDQRLAVCSTTYEENLKNANSKDKRGKA